jgi:hypothetical protein
MYFKIGHDILLSYHNNVTIYRSTLYTFSIYRKVLIFVGRFTALRFTAAGASLAARRIRIFPMNQHAWRPITFGMKGSSYICLHVTVGVESCLSTRRHSSQWRKRFWFNLWSCPAGIFAISLWIFSSNSSVRDLLLWTLSFKQLN